MAARALTAVAGGRRMAVQAGPPLLASCRIGAGNHSTSAQREEDRKSDFIVGRDDDGGAITADDVEAALNCKNVEVLDGEERVVATVLPGEAADALVEGDVAGGEDAWVPDQETSVFVPAADAKSGDGATGVGAAAAADGGSSVLDQTVFVREVDMEDVERPAIDMVNGDDDAK